jgi:retinol dehydrogenase-12
MPSATHAFMCIARQEPASLHAVTSSSLEKAAAARDEIESQLTKKPNIKLLRLDLSSLELVKKAAAHVLAEASRLDILMLNAGIMATPPALTVDRYEQQTQDGRRRVRGPWKVWTE